MTRVCAYSQCDVEFEPRRPHHRFHHESCRYADFLERQQNGGECSGQRVGEHALREVRGQQEEGASADYLQLAREQICRTLLATGYFTADDLEPLGIPKEYRRSVHGSATGYFSGEEPLMEEAGRRKSERPERKGAKNTIFRITAKGRRELPGLLRGMEGPVREARKRLYGDELIAGVGVDGGPSEEAFASPLTSGPAPASPVSVDPGEPQCRPTGDPSSTERPNRALVRASDQSSESSAGTSHAAGDSARQHEALSLLPEPDPELWAA